MRVLFWGTPEFATAPLRALIGEGFDVVGVVTQPDKPVGRSRSMLQASPVKQVAIAENIPLLQPDKPRGDAFLAEMARLEPDVSVVVAYGHILPKAVIDLPRLGTLNIHASLLPALRGAAPLDVLAVGSGTMANPRLKPDEAFPGRTAQALRFLRCAPPVRSSGHG